MLVVLLVLVTPSGCLVWCDVVVVWVVMWWEVSGGEGWVVRCALCVVHGETVM